MLIKFFGPCGSIKDVTIGKKTDGSSRGFAHIEFDNAEGAEKAMGYVGRELDERALKVSKVSKKVKNDDKKGSRKDVKRAKKSEGDRVGSKSRGSDRGSSRGRGGDRGSSKGRGGDRGGKGPMKCYNCQAEGHGSRECPEPSKYKEGDRTLMKCQNCQKKGHGAKECTEPRSDGRIKTVMKCYNCQAEGHGSRDCPEPSLFRIGDRSTMKCHVCQKTGHGERDCPDKPPREDGGRGGRGNSRGRGGSRRN